MDKTIFLNKKFVTNSLFIKKAIELKLSLEEFLMLTYFDNDFNGYLNMENICESLGLSEDIAYETFNSLLKKKLITIDTKKDIEGRMMEIISLDPFFDLIVDAKKEEVKDEEKRDIYASFESEFGRPITSMEYEIINAWLDKNYSEELILGALKEAVYNGVTNLRYIDKILYEWNKKGFKEMRDVHNHLEQKEENSKKELFDYDWMNADE